LLYNKGNFICFAVPSVSLFIRDQGSA
jgi:hypothetical protein